MKKFSFELQEVLDFRNFEQEAAEGELSKALAVENQINENINAIAMQYISLKQELKNNRDFEEIASMNKYKKLLDYQKEQLLNQLAEAKIVTEQKRQVLAECMKKTTALEKLKDLEKEKYKKQAALEEKKQLEELSTVKSVKSVLER